MTTLSLQCRILCQTICGSLSLGTLLAGCCSRCALYRSHWACTAAVCDCISTRVTIFRRLFFSCWACKNRPRLLLNLALATYSILEARSAIYRYILSPLCSCALRVWMENSTDTLDILSFHNHVYRSHTSGPSTQRYHSRPTVTRTKIASRRRSKNMKNKLMFHRISSLTWRDGRGKELSMFGIMPLANSRGNVSFIFLCL